MDKIMLIYLFFVIEYLALKGEEEEPDYGNIHLLTQVLIMLPFHIGKI